jgi:cytochrome c-type biogenesis protein|tara:strand:- start:399 stop:608 length:210 start_codon:yes stop_codon:yes gene_type:complete
MGLAIPFILSGYLLQKFLVVSKNIKTKMNIIVKTGGILLLLTGLLILTNQLQALGFYLLRYMPFLQNLG